MSLGDEAVRLMRSVAGSWQYTNDERRLDPDTYRATDCSGSLRWAFLKLGVDIGYWTGDQSHSGVEVARGHYPWEIPWDAMRPGDRILMTATYWNNYNFDEYLCHTELYCGGGTMIGLPGGWGPTEKWAQAWMEVYKCITWMVRRDFEGDDDMEKTELIATRDDGNIPAWEAWSWAYTYAKEAAAAAGGKSLLENEISTQASGNIPVWQAISWSYTYIKSLVDKIEAMQKTIDKLKVSGATIDYDKLAKALAPVVADELSARLKA